MDAGQLRLLLLFVARLLGVAVLHEPMYRQPKIELQSTA